MHTEINDVAGSGELKDINEYAHLKPEDISDAIVYLLSMPANVNISELTVNPAGEEF